VVLQKVYGLRSLRRPFGGTPHDVGVLEHFSSRLRMSFYVVQRDPFGEDITI